MNTRKTIILIAYVLVCGLTTVFCFKAGRGSGDVSEPRAEPKRDRPVRSATSWRRLAAASAPRFRIRGEASMDELERRFGDAAAKSPLTIEPEVLALAAELRSDEFPEAAVVVAALPEPGRRQLLMVVLARWSEFEPKRAAEFALELPGDHDLREGLASILQAWGHKDPEGALFWIQDLVESGRYAPRVGIQSSMTHLFHSWAQDDPKAAAAAAENLAANGGSSYPWFGIGALAAVDEHRPQALAAAEEISDRQWRLKAVVHVAGGWAGCDPAAAAAWLDQRGYLDEKTEWAVSQRYGKRDPRANIEWLSRRTPEERREKAMAIALNYWALNDVVSAAAWLEERGPIESCIPVIARCYATVDLEKAVEWASRASEENRDGVIAEALATARIHDLQADISSYLEAGSLTSEEMSKKVEEKKAILQRRF